MVDNILVLAAAGGLFAKALVDGVKLAADLPRWVPPALALVFGVGVEVLLMVSQETALTLAVLATCALAGVLAAGTAIGVTELGNRAADLTNQRRSQPPRG